MVKQLKITAFHKIVRLYFGRQPQLDKVLEEVRELHKAVSSGNKKDIAEELADVELTLPYLKAICIPHATLRIEPQTSPEPFLSVSAIVILALTIMNKHGDNAFIIHILEIALMHYCRSLHTLYEEYGYTIKEIDDIVDYKKRRTLKRIAGGYYGKKRIVGESGN